MEGGVLGEAVAYLVEEEAGRELVQTLPQPMEETIVWGLLVRLVTQMTVGVIQVLNPHPHHPRQPHHPHHP